MADMCCPLCTVGQAASWRQFRVIDVVCASGEEFDVWTAHVFDGDDSGESPEVGVGYPRVLCFDGFEEDACVLEAGVGGL